MPKVSVIVPVYNVENFLPRCLDSLISQTLDDIEIICVDDGSTDSSEAMLQEYAQRDNRIKILQQQNQFAGVARNNGLKVATGEYVIFLDSDDVFNLQMLEKMYNRAVETGADITVCESRFFIDNINNLGDTYGIRYQHLPEKSVFSPKEIKDNNLYQAFVGWAWDKLYKKDFVLKSGLEFQALKSSNDMYFGFLSIALADKIALLDDVLVYYRKNNPNSIGALRTKFTTCFYEALSAMKDYFCANNLFELYKNSYYNYLLEFGLRVFNLLYDYKVLVKMYKFLREEVFNDEQMADVLKQNHYNEKEYKIYKLIRLCPNYFIFSLSNLGSLFSIKNSSYKLNKVVCIFGHKFCFRRRNG